MSYVYSVCFLLAPRLLLKPKLWCLFALSSHAFIPSVVSAAAITTNSALPIGQGQFIVREQVVSQRISNSDTEVRQDSLVSTFAYGVSPKWAVFANLPWSERDLSDASGTRSSRGIDDLSVFSRYTAYQRNKPGKTFRIAPFFGLEAPTGRDTEQDDIGQLPPALQNGNGAWDVFGGVATTYATANWTADFQLRYQHNRQANDFELGDEFRIDASLQYRISPRKLSVDTTRFINAVVEANLIHQLENQFSGVNDPNSGGTNLFIAPGLQYITQSWIAEASLQIPVDQNANGTGFEPDYIGRIGFRLNF